MEAGFGAACFVGFAALFGKNQLQRRIFADHSDVETGVQRRRIAPPALEIWRRDFPGSYEVEVANKVEIENERGFVTLENGLNIFYQIWSPKTRPVEASIVLIHGYGDHSDNATAFKARTLCSLGRFVAASFDLPGHGRSDGEFVCVNEWSEFVALAREVIEVHLKPMLERKFQVSKVFGIGESMGGATLFALLVKEKHLFDGAVLLGPMLVVAEEMFPPWIVLQIFKHVLVRICPMWPIMPSEDISQRCSQDPEFRTFINEHPVHRKILGGRFKPRVRTAYELAFAASEFNKMKLADFDTPALIIHGAGDVVTDPKVSETLFKVMKNKDKNLVMPHGVWHADLLHGGCSQFDDVKQRYALVAKWIQERA